MNKTYYANINEVSNQQVIGENGGMTAERLMEAIAEFRAIPENIYRPIEVTDEAGRILINEERP